MGSTVQEFWSSLMKSEEIRKPLDGLMNIQDLEERALLMVSKILFLFTMGIKNERDAAEKEMKLLKSKLQNSTKEHLKCSKCSIIIKEQEEMITVINDKENHIKAGQKISPKNNRKRPLAETEDEYNLPKVRFKESRQCSSPKVRFKDIKFESPIKMKVAKHPKENPDVEADLFRCETTPVKIGERILAPETQAIDDMPHKKSVRKFIPETVQMDSFDIDFFEDCETSTLRSECSANVTCARNPDDFLSPGKSESSCDYKLKSTGVSPRKCFSTPDKTQTIDIVTQYSPIIGKPHAVNQNLPITKPKYLSKENKDIESKPSTAKDESPLKSRTSQLKSKLKGNRSNLNTDQSPSKTELQKHIYDPQNQLSQLDFSPITLSSDTSPCKDLKDEKPKSTKFLSCAELNSKTNKFKSKKIPTTVISKKIEISKNPKYEVTINSPSPTKEKRCRQIKITAQLKAKNEGTFKRTFSKEEDELQKALNESLKTKQLEDMKRKNLHCVDDLPLNTIDEPSHAASSLVHNNIKTKSSFDPNPLNNLKGQDKANILDENEIMDLLNQDSQEIEEPVPAETKPQIQNKPLKKITRKQQRINDSFDMPERKVIGEDGKVVRKKHERKQMEGWSCKKCQDFYDGKNLTENEIKELQNRCSRHRSKYNPISNTPKGYWNPDWESDD